uniref:Uncharacterized protein n=1 Tax=Anguilla anguilla TaxID=7936 RepID=A0A0E9VH86_ANGAN
MEVAVVMDSVIFSFSSHFEI